MLPLILFSFSASRESRASRQTPLRIGRRPSAKFPIIMAPSYLEYQEAYLESQGDGPYLVRPSEFKLGH